MATDTPSSIDRLSQNYMQESKISSAAERGLADRTSAGWPRVEQSANPCFTLKRVLILVAPARGA